MYFKFPAMSEMQPGAWQPDSRLIYAVRILVGVQEGSYDTLPPVPVDSLSNYRTYLNQIQGNLATLYIDNQLQNLGQDMRNGIMVSIPTPFLLGMEYAHVPTLQSVVVNVN